MARPKKSHSSNAGPMDPMAAAILAGLRPHIEGMVKDQVASILLDVLAKIAPERLAKARSEATVEGAPNPALPAPETPVKAGNGSAKAAQAGK